MNKGFFVIFFMYFFVVQSAIFGIVRGEPKFYIIGIVNLVFIILMALFYKNFDKATTEGKKDVLEPSKSEHIVHRYHSTLHASRKGSGSIVGYLFVISIVVLFLVVLDKAFLDILPLSVWRFAGVYFIMLFLSAKKLLDKKIILGDTVFLPKDFLFWTSLIIVIGVYGTLVLQVLAFKLLFAACIGFIFFFIGARIIKEPGSALFKLFFTRFYLILIAVLALILGAQSFSSTYKYKLSQDWNTIQSLFTNGFSFTRIQNEGNVFTGPDLLSNGTGQVLSTSLSPDGTVIIEEPSSDVFGSGESSDLFVSPKPAEEAPAVAVPPAPTEPEEDDRLSVPLFPTLMDVLIYLMDHYDIPLSSQKNTLFTYVSPKNPYYAQFKTAYDMKLIGKNSNPSKRVLCQTYMVMKGLLEEWTVASAADIKSTYRNEAIERGVLNGCKWNFYVRNINL